MKRVVKRKIILLFTLFFSFIYWIFSAVNNPQIPTQQTAPQENCLLPNCEPISGLARVVDGDTIEINKQRIRLVGIDAPEKKQKCLDKNYYEYLCGESSTTFLKKLINSKNVICSYQEKDMYSRYLGECKLDDLNINQEMIKSGMAIIYNMKEADEEMKKLEKQAKEGKLGIWQGSFLEPKEYRRKNHRKSTY